ncbi:MAG: GntR family transcriptional regulator [Hyphomicrobiaceae bacterium]|nr:GntR family transcriptional regulator [Hyphomicrobiaceae bacterium]
MALAAPLIEDEPSTLGARVYAELSGLLMRGELSPGDKLSLRSIAVRLGLSMQPVRQAVDRLVADEALEVLPNRAVRVPVMTAARLAEITRIRIAIEGFATEEAAAAWTAADMAEISRHDAAFRRECRKRAPDLARAVTANRDLHFSIYRAAGLPSLMPIIEGLWLRVGPVLNLDMRASPERIKLGAGRCHADLMAALARRDGRAARAALTVDITGAAKFIASRGILP